MGDAQTKIRIFSLAKELGLDSKVLIEHCRAAGLTVKGSALASISPDEKQVVLDHIAGEKSKEPDPAESLAPTREPTGSLGARMRQLRTMTPRDTARPAAPPEDDSPAEGAPTVEPPAADTAAEDEEVTPPEEAPDLAAAETTESTAEAAATSDAAPPKPVGIRKEDYMPAHGSERGVREMRPRSMTAIDRSARGKSNRDQPSGPVLAEMPDFQPAQPKQAPKEETAQKPEIRLTPDQMSGAASPLARHLQKAEENKKTRRKKDTQFTDGENRGRDMMSTQSGREARRRQRSRQVQVDDDDGRREAGRGRLRRKKSGPTELKTSAEIEAPITVRSLSEAIGRPGSKIVGYLAFEKGMGRGVTINSALDEETAWEVAAHLGVELEIKRAQSSSERLQALLDADDPEESLVTRPPVVTILGHVDHGKTSLLDKIRSTNVVDGEAGGITQHIRAYQVPYGEQRVTFVDTPGHAAFGEMRARGANVTDIIVLVVAANDSVMPQTVECINHAKASGAPILVAMNKMDLPSINEQKVLTDLATNGVQPQEWGGEVEVIRTSAETGDGLDDLLETILLTAEIGELTANPDRQALGVCLEAFQDEGVGPIAWIIVQKGTLRIGDVILCGQTFGRIRAMYNDRGEMIEEALPSMPVKVTGLDAVPGAGDHFFVMDDVDEAREIAEEAQATGRAELLSSRNPPRTMIDILEAARQGEVQELKLIIKADTPGSIEAIKGEIEKFDHPEVKVKVLHEAVGGVNESDIYLASASDAVIVAFHVIAEDRALQLADQEGVDIRRYNIIYEVIDEIKNSLEGMLEPEKVQVATGRAVVLQTFSISRTGTIAGCRVLNGTIERNNRVHVIRDQKVLNDYPIASLKRVKDDAKEVREGMECGIRLDGFNDVKEGDLLEAFRIDSVKRTLDD